VQYWHILLVAIVNGLVATIEMPARQSTISRIVPPEDLAAAIPLNAVTFNLARVVGPAIGGVLLASFGAQVCYVVNGLSYLALIFALMAVRADLSASAREPQPMKDLLFEGMLYTFRDVRLKTLFVLESLVSACALFYIALMPAITRGMLGLGAKGLGNAFTSVGIGAILGLMVVTRLADLPIKAVLVRGAMTLMGASMLALSWTRSPGVAFLLFAFMGFAAVTQFNVTNTLFQMLSPDRLRGRVLSMHIWALAGVGPFGTLFFGWLSSVTSVPLALRTGGCLILAAAVCAWARPRGLDGAE
jgi:predicted MFS family arabinose efflux permease